MDVPPDSMGVTIDMNDPANLCLFSKLIRFQVDLSEHELRFNHPDKLMQRTLQSLAHGVGLEYEYFLSSREARITRVAVSTTLDAETPIPGYGQAVLGRRGSENGCDSSAEVRAGDTSNQQPASTTTLANDLRSEFVLDWTPDFSTNDLPEVIFNFDYNSNGEQRVEEPDLRAQGLQETANAPPGHPGGEDSLEYLCSLYNSVAPGCDDKNITQAQPPISDPTYSWQEIDYEHSSASIVHSDQLSSSLFSTNLSSTMLLQEDLSATSSDASLFSFRRTRSRTSSISSFQSSDGRGKVSKVISNKSSLRRPDNSAGFQEFTFDSRPASRTLALSGRRGTLNPIARAAMKAVTAAGACWRCKFLRKQCDTETACDTCPRSSLNSHWRLVGCKRGTLKSAMVPIILCRRAALGSSTSPMFLENPKNEVLRARANGFSRQAIKRRPEYNPTDMDSLSQNNAEIDPFFQGLIKRWPALKPFQNSKFSSLNHPSQPMLIPLDECILAILWETFDCPLSKQIIGSVGDTLILMRAAALYQITTGIDQLVAQSLVCLRSCLEALRLKYSGFLDIISHQACESSSCKIDCIAQLNSSLTKYLLELSRVFFKKENMRSKSWSWRLSVFYSFCIQSIVRKALINLVGIGGSIDSSLGAQKYLHHAIRLFIASSGMYDPLMQNFSLESNNLSDEEVSRAKYYKLAQYAIQRDKWASIGITSTADYLKRIFEDNGMGTDSDFQMADTMTDNLRVESPESALHV